VEEDLMRYLHMGASRQAQRGFSMVEMLMTAFILAVGIMGLTLLQVMSLKGSRGGRSLSTAIQVGEMVMDQIEMEGRLSWLNVSDTKYNPPLPMAGLQYVNRASMAAPLKFTIKGQSPVTGAPNPVDSTPFYTVNFAKVDVAAAGSGTISDFAVTVTFSDQSNPTTGVAIPRVVTITRRILHG
jgi:prepilin-type N-terminal cleavage/methylation domain-containing protein